MTKANNASELKTILEYIATNQADRLSQSEWINIAKKILNGGEVFDFSSSPTDTNQVISFPSPVESVSEDKEAHLVEDTREGLRCCRCGIFKADKNKGKCSSWGKYYGNHKYTFQPAPLKRVSENKEECTCVCHTPDKRR